MIDLIGCPMHYGVSDDGLKQSIDTLNKLYTDLGIRKINTINVAEQALENLKNLNSVIATCELLAYEVDKIIQAGRTPLCIGGDHSLAIGTISGSAKKNKRLGLLWVDSHSDINTASSTITGNIHGMPVSAVMGYGEEKLVKVYGESPKVLPQNVVLFGLRDVDPLEYDIIDRLGVKCYFYKDIVSRGLDVCLNEAREYLANTDCLHLSFDLDSMNPELIKGVTVPVKGGFVESDVEAILNYCFKSFTIASADLVEYNPKYDTDKYTAQYAYKLIQMFKKI